MIAEYVMFISPERSEITFLSELNTVGQGSTPLTDVAKLLKIVAVLQKVLPQATQASIPAVANPPTPPTVQEQVVLLRKNLVRLQKYLELQY